MRARVWLGLLLSIPVGPAAAQKPVGIADTWPLDEVALVNGAKFRGLIIDDNPLGMTFQTVKRPPGRPTLTFTTFFAKKEIDKVVKLNEADRVTLRARLAELDSNGAGERQRMDDLELKSVEWLGRKDGAQALRSRSIRFIERRTGRSHPPRGRATGANLHGIRPLPAGAFRADSADRRRTRGGSRSIQTVVEGERRAGFERRCLPPGGRTGYSAAPISAGWATNSTGPDCTTSNNSRRPTATRKKSASCTRGTSPISIGFRLR